MNGKVTDAPDKRVAGGAVPPTRTTTGCFYCDLGDKPIKLKRQYVHHYKHRLVVCENQD